MNRSHKTFTMSNSETRFQSRYLDFMVNNGLIEIFRTRSRILQFLRSFLERKGFMEVETPILQGKAGGALAKPFTTHSSLLGEHASL